MPPIPGTSAQRWVDRFGLVWAYIGDLLLNGLPTAGDQINYLAGAFGWLG